MKVRAYDYDGLLRVIDELRAEAWDEGYRRGLRDAEQGVQHKPVRKFLERYTR